MSLRDSPIRRVAGSRWVRLGAAAALVLALGVAIVRWARPAARSNIAVVQRGTIAALVEATGQVRSAREVRLSLPVSGRVASVPATPGDQVADGQVLLRLDPSEADRRVREAELQLEARQQELRKTRAGPSDADIELAQANLRQAVVGLQVAQASYDKIADRPDAATSPEALALETARTTEQRARAEYDRTVEGPTPEDLAWLETQTRLAEIALEQARAAQAQTDLRAPFAGTVVQVQPRVGENVNGYSPLVTLADMTQLETHALVDEVDVGEVTPGQAVEMRLDAFPSQVLPGRVKRISPAASTERGATQFEMIVEFLSGDPNVAELLPRLRLGMGANLKITTVEKADVTLVPSRAVQSVGRKKVVKVLDGGQPREVEVTVGLSNGVLTEIVEGLTDGQVVLVE